MVKNTIYSVFKISKTDMKKLQDYTEDQFDNKGRQSSRFIIKKLQKKNTFKIDWKHMGSK